jgi:hypothetical protein
MAWRPSSPERGQPQVPSGPRSQRCQRLMREGRPGDLDVSARPGPATWGTRSSSSWRVRLDRLSSDIEWKRRFMSRQSARSAEHYALMFGASFSGPDQRITPTMHSRLGLG